jgi:ABC-type branched-subunit amino acid transport system ATPase component
MTANVLDVEGLEAGDGQATVQRGLDRVYVLAVGSLAASGTVAELQQDDAVKRAYLGY